MDVINNDTKKKVDALFDEAEECFENKVRAELKSEIKTLMQQRRGAQKVLANVDREIAELKLKIAHELG